MRSGWPARRKRRWQHTASWSGSGPGPAHPRCRAGRRNAPGPPGGPAGVTALLPVIYSGVQRPRCGQTGCRCAPPGQAASPARDRALPSRRRNIRSQPRNSKRHSSGRERKAPVTPAAQRQPPPERGQPPSLPPSLGTGTRRPQVQVEFGRAGGSAHWHQHAQAVHCQRRRRNDG